MNYDKLNASIEQLGLQPGECRVIHLKDYIITIHRLPDVPPESTEPDLPEPSAVVLLKDEAIGANE